MRSRLLFLPSLVLIALSPAAPSDQERPRDLNPLLEPIRQQHDLPALAGAVVTSERLVALGAVGVRKYGASTPVTVNDQFHLGSCTKSMTATLVAMLVEQGKLSWSDTIGHAFPGLTGEMQADYRDVTVEQLLCHRGGFSPPERSSPEGTTLDDMRRLPGSPREQRLAYVKLALRQPPEAKPGTRFLYSNMGYTVAGAMAERAANKPWEALITERLFRPLRMRTAGFGPMGSLGRIDQPWQHTVEGGKHVPVKPAPDADNPPVLGPAGRVHCSLPDWARYVQAHLRGERGRNGLLKPETFRKLHTPPFGDPYVFGWGVGERDWAGGRVLQHAGSNTMNYAVVWVALQRDFAVLVATNQAGGGAEKACDEAVGALIRWHQHPEEAHRSRTENQR